MTPDPRIQTPDPTLQNPHAAFQVEALTNVLCCMGTELLLQESKNGVLHMLLHRSPAKVKNQWDLQCHSISQILIIPPCVLCPMAEQLLC